MRSGPGQPLQRLLRRFAIADGLGRIIVFQLVEAEADAIEQDPCLGDGVGVLGEQPRHLACRLQVPLGVLLQPAAGGTINLAHLLLGHGGELGWVEWLVFDERAGFPIERPYELRYGRRPGTDAAAGDMDQAVRVLFDPDGVFPEQGQRF